jgi:hypothetical protein
MVKEGVMGCCGQKRVQYRAGAMQQITVKHAQPRQVPRKCPRCSWPMANLLTMKNKVKITSWVCNNKNCRYRINQ